MSTLFGCSKSFDCLVFLKNAKYTWSEQGEKYLKLTKISSHLLTAHDSQKQFNLIDEFQ